MTPGELATLLALVRARVEDGTVSLNSDGSWTFCGDFDGDHPAELHEPIQALVKADYYGERRSDDERLAAIDRAIALAEEDSP